MTDVVERAKAALEGVSPGPWRTEPSKYISGHYVITRDNRTAVHATLWDTGDDGVCQFGRCDFRFAAEARQLVPDLVAEVHSLRRQLAQARGVEPYLGKATGGL